MKKMILFFLVLFSCLNSLSVSADNEKIHIDVLILPKFETGEMYGDFPGEAQFYYEAYLMDADEHDINGSEGHNKLYVKDGIAMYITEMGKVNAALSTMSVLMDERFDFSDAYIISTGCGGSAIEYGVMGDVFIITSAIDYDLGHHADIREMESSSDVTWFRDIDNDDAAFLQLDPELMDQIYDLVKDIRLETTEVTRNFMANTFDNAEWAVRDPKVLRGTTMTGDNYWKGIYDHKNALAMVESYGAPDPFAVTEMEDLAIGLALKRLGMLDRYIIIRVSVNTDVFMNGMTPERIWSPETVTTIASESSVESADIFATAMENNYRVGSVIIQAILDGTLTQ